MKTSFVLCSALPIAGLLLAFPTYAQQPRSIVRRVEIKGSFVTAALQKKIDSIAGVGYPYNAANLSKAQVVIREELTGPETVMPHYIAGAVSVLTITQQTLKAPAAANGAEQVDVRLLPFYLRIDRVNVGNNYLPVPHNLYVTFWKHVPPLLRSTTPVFGLSSDRKYGLAAFLQSRSNILTPDEKKRIRLDLDLGLNKSLNEQFHDVGTRLSAEHTGSGLSLSAAYRHSVSPLDQQLYRNGNVTGLIGIHGDSKIPFFHKYALTVGTSFAKNNLSTLISNKTSEIGIDTRLTGDQQMGSGIGRLSIFFGNRNPKGNLSAYQRLMGTYGYAFVIGKGHINADIETMTGGGLSWGNLPSYAGYRAGSSGDNFLYQPITGLAERPVYGPLIRSLGVNQGKGSNSPSTAYWHFNLTASLPIPGWSRPLVPDIAISENPTRLTLAKALKGQINTAQAFIYDDLVQRQGKPDNEETNKEATKIVERDIRPAIEYLADRANIFSVKPITLFDIGRLYDKGVDSGATWISGGLGVQFMVVNVKVQTAYMHSFKKQTSDYNGNFILRLTFQNFY